MRRIWAVLAVAVWLSGCASVQQFAVRAGLVDPLAVAKQHMAAGRVMEARKVLLSVPKDDPAYARARAMLRKEVEPARLKLIRRYRIAAEKAEAHHEWWRAKELYEQAASFSIMPQALLERAHRAEMRMRRARFLQLLSQRRSEDAPLVGIASAYRAPEGVASDDWVVERMRRNAVRFVERRADQALDEAEMYLRKGLPEIAYIEIESHLRLAPDSVRGQQLRAEILQKMPKGIAIPPLGSKPRAKKTRKRKKKKQVRMHPTAQKPVAVPSWQDVASARKKGDLLKARALLARLKRASTGKERKKAEKMLAEIDAEMAKAAKEHYERGRVFFRKEQLDAAIKEWRMAVRLAPDNLEYEQALRRARLLKERLDMLRAAEKEPAPAGEKAAIGEGEE